jgi:hypothetical protein
MAFLQFEMLFRISLLRERDVWKRGRRWGLGRWRMRQGDDLREHDDLSAEKGLDR